MSKNCYHCKETLPEDCKISWCEDCYPMFNKYWGMHLRCENRFINANRPVYFILHPSEPRIKIGISKNLEDRLYSISLEEKAKCKFLAFQIGGNTQETYLHRLFAHIRLGKQPSGKEWFRDTPELRQYIQYYAYSYKKAQALLYYKWKDYIEPIIADVPEDWRYMFLGMRLADMRDYERFLEQTYWLKGDISFDDYYDGKPLEQILANKENAA
jgi:hypothetical protein